MTRLVDYWLHLKSLPLRHRVLVACAVLLLTPAVWAFDQWYQPVHHFTIPPDFPGIDARASHPAHPHCQAHWDAGARKSGLYRIDTGLLMREQTLWCEMTATEGLTLIVNSALSNSEDGNTSKEVYPESPPHPRSDTEAYKLSDQLINQLADGYRLELRYPEEGIKVHISGCPYVQKAFNANWPDNDMYRTATITPAWYCKPTECKVVSGYRTIRRQGVETRVNLTKAVAECDMGRDGVRVTFPYQAGCVVNAVAGDLPCLILTMNALQHYAMPEEKSWNRRKRWMQAFAFEPVATIKRMHKRMRNCDELRRKFRHMGWPSADNLCKGPMAIARQKSPAEPISAINYFSKGGTLYLRH